MSYHRFIGGLHDGEWHDVRRNDGLFLPPIWTVREITETYGGERRSRNNRSARAIDEQPTYQLVPLPVHIGKEEVVTSFMQKPSEAFLRLAACYRPNPGKEQ